MMGAFCTFKWTDTLCQIAKRVDDFLLGFAVSRTFVVEANIECGQRRVGSESVKDERKAWEI